MLLTGSHATPPSAVRGTHIPVMPGERDAVLPEEMVLVRDRRLVGINEHPL
jgi:hypothetical protein